MRYYIIIALLGSINLFDISIYTVIGVNSLIIFITGFYLGREIQCLKQSVKCKEKLTHWNLESQD